jgi:WD40 repeat protein
LLANLRGHSEDIRCLACSPDSDLLLSGDKGGMAKVWDIQTGAELHLLPHHPKRVAGAAFIAGGSLAVTGCKDGYLRLFDARAGWKLVDRAYAWPRMYRIFRPSCATSTLLASAAGKKVGLWDIRNTARPYEMFTSEGAEGVPPTVAATSPDDALLALGYVDGVVKLWAARSGELRHVAVAHAGDVDWAVFHPRDASVLATCGQDGRLKLWQL